MLGEKVVPEITAIRSVPLDTLSVNEISKDRREEDWEKNS